VRVIKKKKKKRRAVQASVHVKGQLCFEIFWERGKKRDFCRQKHMPLCLNCSSEGRFKAAWKREFKLSWREAGPPHHHDDQADSDQTVVNKELSLSQVCV
jgi:hypothetical protein